MPDKPSSARVIGGKTTTVFAQALDHYRQARFREASELLSEAVRAEPHNPQLWNLAGSATKALGERETAERHWRTAIALAPDMAEAHYNLGVLLHESQRYKEAESSFRASLVRPAWHPQALNNLGTSLIKVGDAEEALRCFESAISIHPRYAMAHNNRGRALGVLGRFAEAQQAMETALTHATPSEKVRIYLSISFLKRFKPGDPVLREIEHLAQDTSHMSPRDRIRLQFALGKAYDETGEFDRAFKRFQAGNREKRAGITYHEAEVMANFEHIRTVYSPALLSNRHAVGHPSDVPVFIIGMPRSGSTLVEQILASHPQVHGIGESQYFPDMVEGARLADGRPLLPDGIADLPAEGYFELGKHYLDRIQKHSPRSRRIADKNLGNFKNVGLIHRVFPNAKIIHAQRDPVETCLSCFFHLFVGDHAYAYDLAELGRYWRAYDRLMSHWRSTLPAGVMLEIRYEELIADQEGQTRRLLERCGLEWSDACLSFHLTQRPVHTASQTQVREPIYRTSLKKSGAYAHHLQPLISALEDQDFESFN